MRDLGGLKNNPPRVCVFRHMCIAVHDHKDQPLPSALFEAGLLFAVTCIRLRPQASGASIYASLVTTGALATGVHYRIQPYKGLQLDPSENRKEQKNTGVGGVSYI